MNSNERVLGTCERSGIEIVTRQKELVEQQILLSEFLNAIPVFITVLNKDRQIIFSNNSFLEYLQKTNGEVLGQRPGEAVDCVHPSDGKGGCGTSQFCLYCGALQAILESYEGSRSIEECRISLKENKSLDLMVSATPINLGGEEFTIFTMSDNSSDKRRKALERIFFHDILNTAGGIRGFIDLLKIAEEDELKEYLGISETLTEKLIEEIRAQQLISQAENGDLQVNPTSFSSREILEEVKILYSNHEVAKNKHIEVINSTVDILIKSDKTVLRRILGNLTKNALEASKEGDVILLSAEVKEGFIEFIVENPAYMPEEVQMQLFQRSFSTKGVGRGLGTYSVKLLTEQYLKGEIGFVSNPQNGTMFKAKYPKELKS